MSKNLAAENLIYEVLDYFRSKERKGNHAVLNKRRMEVSGKKPWRQKGTGRARAGCADSPLWVGGAVAHGPQARSYAFRLPRKKIRKALQLLWEDLKQNGNIKVVSESEIAKDAHKTKTWAKLILEKVGNSTSVLIIFNSDQQTLWRDAKLGLRNLKNVKVVERSSLSAKHLLWAQKCIIIGKDLDNLSSSDS